MKTLAKSHSESIDYTALSVGQLVALLQQKDQQTATLTQQFQSLQQQLDWFKRQLFGQKSEKRNFEDNPYQITIAELLKDVLPVPENTEEKKTISYERGKAKKNALDNAQNDSGLRFDSSVPVEEIHVEAPELKGRNSDEFTVIDYKTTFRLAQKPSAFVVLKYIQPVVKEKSTQAITTATAPANVLDKSIADVSLLVGLLIDKFLYHLPLHRQHQRIEANGIKLARSSLTNWVKRSIELLKPIYQSQLEHILLSKTLAIDETPVKAGREKKGKLKQGYFWPLYGDADEICFTFSASRSQQHLWQQLGQFQGTLLSDGYSAYERYAQKHDDVTHAQCWVHTRRYFEAAENEAPQESALALEYIGRLYVIEALINEQALNDDEVTAYRQKHAKPVVDAFFAWVWEQRQRIDLTTTDLLSKALVYAHNREHALRVYLSDGNVQPDTNHLERALRVIPMGRNYG